MKGSGRRPPLGEMQDRRVSEERDPAPMRAWEEPQFAVAIRDRAALEHTCYVELCPNHLRTETCWNKESLYYTERTFHLLSPLLEALDFYTPYSYLHYDATVFEAFVIKLERLSLNLREARQDTQVDEHWFAMGWLSADKRFAEHFQATRERLLALTDDSAQTMRRWREQQPDAALHVLGL